MSTEANDKAVNQAILQGKSMEAFEQYYADDVVMQENTDEPTVGKAANRTREQAFLGMVEEFHGVELLGSAVSGDLSFSEWMFDSKIKGMPRTKMHQVAVRRWKNGKIVHERFYHK